MSYQLQLDMGAACLCCGRHEGNTTHDQAGQPYDPSGLTIIGTVPLGEVTPCIECGAMTCPDCQHEGTCCWGNEDKAEGLT
jgi:hypothetical protein